MVNRLEIFIAILHIQITALWFGILCVELSTVVINGTFSNHNANCPIHQTPFLRRQPVVLLLFPKVTQKHFWHERQKMPCARHGREGLGERFSPEPLRLRVGW